MSAGADWSSELRVLQAKGVISGFVLITATGACDPATGPFAADCAGGRVPPCLQPLLEHFYTSSEAPGCYELWGQKLQVVQSTPSTSFAVGPCRTVGVGALHLPAGVLLVSFGRASPPHQVSSEVHRCCAAMMRGSPAGATAAAAAAGTEA